MRAHDRLSRRPIVTHVAAIVCITGSGDHQRNDHLSMACEVGHGPVFATLKDGRIKMAIPALDGHLQSCWIKHFKDGEAQSCNTSPFFTDSTFQNGFETRFCQVHLTLLTLLTLILS